MTQYEIDEQEYYRYQEEQALIDVSEMQTYEEYLKQAKSIVSGEIPATEEEREKAKIWLQKQKIMVEQKSGIKSSKIESVTFKGDFVGRYGQMFNYWILLENNDAGEIIVKKKDSLSVGDELWYTIEHTERGPKIRRQKNPNQTQRYNANEDKDAHTYSFALSYAKDIIVALIAAGKTGDADSKAIGKATVHMAEEFNAWMLDKAEPKKEGQDQGGQNGQNGMGI